MDIVAKIVVGVSVLYVLYLIFHAGREYNQDLQDRLNAEIDRLHK